jgi:lambda family phage portal protein
MNVLDRAIAWFSPRAGLERVQSRKAIGQLMRYDAASRGPRTKGWRAAAGDADAVTGSRERIAAVARDMTRNAPFAVKAQHVIAANVIGDGIIPKLRGANKRQEKRLREMLKAHFDTTAIDAMGRENLYGLQRLAMMAVVSDGEVLVRRVRTNQPIPFQINVLEIDYLDTDKVSVTDPEIREGIEYNARGERVAYWLYDQHPGSNHRTIRRGLTSRRVPASDILHIYRQDRPGQTRGVSWFAPVALAMQDWADHQDAKLLQQKIAACFAAFRTGIEPEDGDITSAADRFATLSPGRIENLGVGEDIKFATPPSVQGYDEFSRVTLRAIAAGLGITYEALTGDLSGVNFSSGRMGRMEMDRNVSAWQWLMMIPQMMQPIGNWTLEAMGMRPEGRGFTIDWVPPVRFIVDPNREVAAMVASMDAGLSSRQGNIRALGYDPEDVLAEQAEDATAAATAGIGFKSGPVPVSATPQTPPEPAV